VGSSNPAEVEPYGEAVDPRERARLLDEGLSRLVAFWAGGFEPPPVQRPRIPVWVAARWPNRRPVARALRWDGMFPIELPSPDALAELAAEVARKRPDDAAPFDVVVEIEPGEAAGPWAQAGATWVLTGFGPQPTVANVQRAIDAGPGS
jgi:alkanesulfonate monooxygenase SsuD/methylene tetrahydromethanopterin reductase-like flavin-dependent oxidoreductase (luciferase family)